jgi:hypothetical protein
MSTATVLDDKKCFDETQQSDVEILSLELQAVVHAEEIETVLVDPDTEFVVCDEHSTFDSVIAQPTPIVDDER